jgi:hypothetical protein
MDLSQDRLKNDDDDDDDMHQIKMALCRNLVREIQHIFIEFFLYSVESAFYCVEFSIDDFNDFNV